MHSSPSPFPIYLFPSIPFRRRSSSATTNGTASVSSSPPSADPQSCARSASIASTDTSLHLSSSAPSAPPRFLSGHRAHLRCTRCLTDLCLTSQIISKGFTGRHGRAYLVAPPNPYPCAGGNGASTSVSSSDSGTARGLRGNNNLPNTYTHKPVPRQLVTGSHTVSDISCALCGAVLGWKYVAAEEESQKYKVGKFILETKRVCRGVCWENEAAEVDDDDRLGSRDAPPLHKDSNIRDSSEDASSGGGGGGGATGDNSNEAIEFDSQDEDECEDLFAGIWSPALARKRRRGRLWRDARNGANGVEEV